MLEVSEVVKRVRGLVSSRTIVVVEGAVRAFLVNFQPNLDKPPRFVFLSSLKVVS